MNISAHHIGLKEVQGQRGTVAKLPPETVHIGNHVLERGETVLFEGVPTVDGELHWVRRQDVIAVNEA